MHKLKANKNRLAQIGIQTKSGIQLYIDNHVVKVGTDGEWNDIYDFRFVSLYSVYGIYGIYGIINAVNIKK